MRGQQAVDGSLLQGLPAAGKVLLVDDHVHDPDRFLYANPLNRYSIGDRTQGLEYGKDGSLTIYVSNASPGKDKESNWLPAPAGKYSLVARVYGPGPSLMDGSWKLPSLQPAKP